MKFPLYLATMVLTGVAVPAGAAVVSGTLTGGSAFTDGGVFKLIPAPAETGDDNQDTNDIWAWNEQQSVVLMSDLAVDTGPDIAAGTRVSVHGITFDPKNNHNVDGSVTFDNRILAVIWSTNKLVASDFLGVGTIYNSPAARGLEAIDIAGTGFSGNTLFISGWTAAGPGDNIRVLTVPEAGTWAMLVTGFGLLGAAVRRRKAAIA